MRRREVPQIVEPENGKLREDFALIGNPRGQNVVERGDAVGGHDQQVLAQIVNIADLAARDALDAMEFRV